MIQTASPIVGCVEKSSGAIFELQTVATRGRKGSPLRETAMRKFTTCLVATACAVWSVSAQTTVTLDGTSGSNSIATGYSTTGGLTLDLGFYLDVLVVGGGGGGGSRFGGGGGAGGVLQQTNLLLPSLSNAVVVGAGGGGGSASGGTGAGGANSGTNGQNSSFASFIGYGGGGGGAGDSFNGLAGGSGGGGAGRFATSGGRCNKRPGK